MGDLVDLAQENTTVYAPSPEAYFEKHRTPPPADNDTTCRHDDTFAIICYVFEVSGNPTSLLLQLLHELLPHTP